MVSSASIAQLIESCPMQMLQHRTEIIPFCEWMLGEGVVDILEIGTGPGGTTLVFGQLISGTITSIDLIGEGAARVHGQLSHYLQNFKGVQGDSSQSSVLDFIRGSLPRPVDLLFIDGDHKYESVKRDYKTYRKLVRPGGYVAFHDVNASLKWPDMGVKKFWNELKGEKKEFVAGAYSDNPPSWGGIGVITQ